jgi:hypothetical protein
MHIQIVNYALIDCLRRSSAAYSRLLQLACHGDTLSRAHAVLLIGTRAQTLELELTSRLIFMHSYAGLTAMHYQKEGESCAMQSHVTMRYTTTMA